MRRFPPACVRSDRRWNVRARLINRAPVLAIVLALMACDTQQRLPPAAPSAPGPPSPAPPGSSITISGTALEHTANGLRPLPDVSLLVRTFPSFMQVISDATGRYSLSGVTNGTRVSIAPAPGSGYYAPCPSGSSRGITSDTHLDVHVVSAELLATAGAPSTMPRLESIWVSGTAFERTPQGIRPIAGAAVHLADVGPLEDASDPRFSSNTLTDAAGRYLLCPPIPGTGTDTYAMVSVQREGYQPAGRAAFLGWDYDGFDIELRPRALTGIYPASESTRRIGWPLRQDSRRTQGRFPLRPIGAGGAVPGGQG